MNNHFNLNMNKTKMNSIIQQSHIADSISTLAQRVLRKAYFEFYGKSVRSLSDIETDLVLVGCNELKNLISNSYEALDREELQFMENIIVYLSIQQCDKLNESNDIKDIISKSILKRGIPELREYIH